MGALFKNESVGLFEDLPKVDDMKKLSTTELRDIYHGCAIKCWIGCGLYVVLFVVSSVRFYMLVR
jgi:hypothetical protein